MENNDFDPKDYENAFNKTFDEKHEEFEKITNQKLIISLIGSVNAGKSSTINALTGKNYTEVKARAGWTKMFLFMNCRKEFILQIHQGYLISILM